MKRLTIVLILLIFGWGTIIFFSVLASMPYNPISLSYDIKINVQTVLPEGWGFFSKPPREPRIVLFKKDGAHFRAYNTKVSDYRNLFGIKRNSRAISTEMARIAKGVPKEHWQNCDVLFSDCIKNGMMSPLKIKNTYSAPLLCGIFCIVSQEPVPWAWSKHRQEVVMPSKFILIDIECSGN